MANLNKSQIDIVKFFKEFGIDIFKHKTITGIMIEEVFDEEIGEEAGNLVGFFSRPLGKLAKNEILKNPINGEVFQVAGGAVYTFNGVEPDIVPIAEEFNILDLCDILGRLQDAADEGLVKIGKEFDVVIVELVGADEDCLNDDDSTDMKTRGK